MDDFSTRLIVAALLFAVLAGLAATYVFVGDDRNLSGIDFHEELREHEDGLTDPKTRADAPDYGFDPERSLHDFSAADAEALCKARIDYFSRVLPDSRQHAMNCFRFVMLMSSIREESPTRQCEQHFDDCIERRGSFSEERVEELRDLDLEPPASDCEMDPQQFRACSARVGDVAAADRELEELIGELFDDFDCEKFDSVRSFRRLAPLNVELQEDCPAAVTGM